MLPDGIPTVRVTGRYLSLDDEGQPLSGQVIFRAPSLITFPDYDVILGGPVTAPLDATGAFEVDLPATDAPGMNPSGWSYQVAEQLAGVSNRPPFQVLLPAETPTVDIADIAPTDPTTPTYVAVRGDSAYEVAVENGFAGTESEWLASLVGPQGTEGDPGSKIYKGPVGPGTGLDGDVSINTSTGFLYWRENGAWVNQGSIRGPQGIQGATGPKGDPGNTLGVYVPDAWGEYWRTKRAAAAAGTGLARVIAVGGSSTAGWHASDLINTSWVGRLKNALQSQYGDGGSGFFPVSRSATIISATAAIPAWQAAGCLVEQAGTWRAGSSLPGPGITYVYTETADSTITFRVTGETVRIYTVAGPPPAGTRAAWAYTIDGGAPVTVQDAGGAEASIQVTTVSGLSAAEHTVTLAWAGTVTDTDQFFSVCGVEGERATGVVVDNLARPGAASNRYAAQSATVGAIWNGGANFHGDLAIYSAAPNDAAATPPVTGAQWETNLVSWLRAVREANYDTDVMIVIPHIGRYESAPIYHEYSARARTIAEAYGAALVNTWTLGKNSWDYWNSLGYWGTQTNPGGPGTDGVHPSDAGHAYIADQVLPLLTR
ncbi:GDSL-type esterase/lipase family protein [Streptomyces sp. NPDC096048]|uniref:GDSL-type esterase/lipase family protein n=1 Tax=Streptomyces sp. NPDC096048 TaxID=3366072 RepID=UPI00382CFE05